MGVECKDIFAEAIFATIIVNDTCIEQHLIKAKESMRRLDDVNVHNASNLRSVPRLREEICVQRIRVLIYYNNIMIELLYYNK